ncbi:MAG TPA: MoaD/ThiS family protein [Mesotoga sp.]|nr:MoaD/ThiS family protein [Mesotoga sp.]MDI9374584.1 MoaD/ThiS family protein [Thermotogota bacterium]NLX33162.1 MoaD/ThiS family protein [Thermotogaceae bacterium]MDD4041385.1 MoaD/ThiS family protein [Mesotoga sp.]MDD4478327.1 MoaD/ThiS family protein [Mesotoga sp.]
MKVEYAGGFLSLEGEMTARELLDRLGLDFEDHLVIKDGSLVPLEEKIEDSSNIIILKAVVGG